MKITKIIIGLLIFGNLFTSCKNNEKADGYGNFEATEITVSAENSGKLIQLMLKKARY
jgi:HlyD family secretion protein